LLPLTVVVALSLVHATPFETLAAALAGAAIITPPATTSASVREASLRIRKTSIGYVLMVASPELKTPENPPMNPMNSL
jgi:hypothetical protein